MARLLANDDRSRNGHTAEPLAGMPNDSQRPCCGARGPASCRTGVGAVRLLTDRDWRRALEYCDRSHLTLALHRAARDAMPDWVRERTDRNAAQNQQRLRRTEEAYRSAARRLNASQN